MGCLHHLHPSTGTWLEVLYLSLDKGSPGLLQVWSRELYNAMCFPQALQKVSWVKTIQSASCHPPGRVTHPPSAKCHKSLVGRTGWGRTTSEGGVEVTKNAWTKPSMKSPCIQKHINTIDEHGVSLRNWDVATSKVCKYTFWAACCSSIDVLFQSLSRCKATNRRPHWSRPPAKPATRCYPHLWCWEVCMTDKAPQRIRTCTTSCGLTYDEGNMKYVPYVVVCVCVHVPF